MNVDEIIKTGLAVGATIIGSIGGGACILTAVIKWWGDILAQKMLAKVENKYVREIEGYKAELQDVSNKFNAMLDYSMQVATKQYDMEIKIYQDIWKALHELLLCNEEIYHFQNPTEADPVIYSKLLETTYNQMNKKYLDLKQQIDSKAPFYQEKAYNILYNIDKEYTRLLKILKVSANQSGMSSADKDVVNNKILPKISDLKEQ